MTTSLPEGFVALEPFVHVWSVEGAAARDALRGSQSATERQAFFDSISPILERALDRLDKTPLADHSAAERRLMLLLLSFAHVALAVDVQGSDEAKHEINRRHLHITRAPADF